MYLAKSSTVCVGLHLFNRWEGKWLYWQITERIRKTTAEYGPRSSASHQFGRVRVVLTYWYLSIGCFCYDNMLFIQLAAELCWCCCWCCLVFLFLMMLSLATYVNYAKINNSMLRMRSHISASCFAVTFYCCKINKWFSSYCCKCIKWIF